MGIICRNLFVFKALRADPPPHRAKESDRAEGGGITKNFSNVNLPCYIYVISEAHHDVYYLSQWKAREVYV